MPAPSAAEAGLNLHAASTAVNTHTHIHTYTYTRTQTYRQTDRGGYGEGRRVVLGRAEVLLMQRRAWIIQAEQLSIR